MGQIGTNKAKATSPWPSSAAAWYAVGILFVAYTFSFAGRFILSLLIAARHHQSMQQTASGRERLFTSVKLMPGEWLLCAAKRNYAFRNSVWRQPANSGQMAS